jgi:hypothetical protein
MKRIFLLFLMATLFGLVACGGPLYSRTDQNTDYWGLANADGQLKAIAIERIRQEQDGTWVPSGPERPGIVMNGKSEEMVIEIIGPEMSGKHIVSRYGDKGFALYEGEIYLFSVYKTNGEVYKFFDKTERRFKEVKNWPLIIHKKPVSIQYNGRSMDVHWWITIE